MGQVVQLLSAKLRTVGLLIPAIWKLLQITFKSCFVMYDSKSNLFSFIGKNCRGVQEMIFQKNTTKCLQEIFQSINA